MTAKEEVLAKREGYKQACLNHSAIAQRLSYSKSYCEYQARFHIAMPKVTRSRVVKLHGLEYRVTNGVVEWANLGESDWSIYGITEPSAGNLPRLKLLVDLLENPTEEVNDE